MPSTYTPLLRLTLPADGELVGTWGQTVNNGVTALVESSIAGTATVAMADVATTTLTIASGATDQARAAVLRLTGSLTAQRDVVCPSVSKTYFVRNNTTGGFGVRVKTAAGTGVVVPNGGTALLYCDGTNVSAAMTAIATLTVDKLQSDAAEPITLSHATASIAWRVGAENPPGIVVGRAASSILILRGLGGVSIEGGTEAVQKFGGVFQPQSTNTVSLGTTALRWSSAWITGAVNAATGAFSGTVAAAAPTLDGHLTTKLYVDTAVSGADFLPSVGGTLTGPLTGTSATFTGAVSTGALSSTTGSFSGLVTAATAPTAGGHLTNKTYVDAKVTGFLSTGGGTLTGALTGTSATFSGGVTAASFSGQIIGGAVSGTTGTFTGAVSTGALSSSSTGSFSGAVTASTAPSLGGHLTNKTYVDAKVLGAAFLPIIGGTLTGALGGTTASFSGAVGATGGFSGGPIGGSSGSFSGHVSIAGNLTVAGASPNGVLTGRDIIGTVSITCANISTQRSPAGTFGYMLMTEGTATVTGYGQYMDRNGIRVGYIGAGLFTGAPSIDTGTMRYVAGTHEFFGAVTNPSDRALKDAVETRAAPLEAIAAIPPRTWLWKASGKRSFGAIADELAQLLPELVHGEPGSQGIEESKAALYLVLSLAQAVAALKARVDAL